jgi:hypothetical protein
MTARKLKASMTNAAATPTAPINRPARAGPMIRALLNIAELSATALPMSSRPTISTTKDWRTGMSKALAVPIARAMTRSSGNDSIFAMATNASAIERHIFAAWVTSSVRRFGRESARTPANRPSTRTGMNWAAAITPSHRTSPVSWRTSHAWATCCIHVPMRLVAWPAKKRR